MAPSEKFISADRLELPSFGVISIRLELSFLISTNFHQEIFAIKTRAIHGEESGIFLISAIKKLARLVTYGVSLGHG